MRAADRPGARPTSGELRGARLHELPERRRSPPARSSASSPQLDNLDVDAHRRAQPRGRRPPLPGRASRPSARPIDRALDRSRASVDRRRDARVDELSGGMRRRLLIARALVHRPRLVLLDEPTVGLDPQVRQELWALIDALRVEGTTILMSTHYIEEAQRLADTVMIMSHGKAVATGPPSLSPSTQAGRRSRSTARRRSSPRSRGVRARRRPPHAANRDQRLRARHRGRGRERAGRGRAAAGEPRGRIRLADRGADRLMAVATPPQGAKLGRLERPALTGVLVREIVNYVVLEGVRVLLSPPSSRQCDLRPRSASASARSSARSAATTTSTSSRPAPSRPPCCSRARSRRCSGRTSSTRSNTPTTRSSRRRSTPRRPCPPKRCRMSRGGVMAACRCGRDRLRPRSGVGMLTVPFIAFVGFGGDLWDPRSPAIRSRSTASATSSAPSSHRSSSWRHDLPARSAVGVGAGSLDPVHHCVEPVRHAAFGFEGWGCRELCLSCRLRIGDVAVTIRAMTAAHRLMVAGRGSSRERPRANRPAWPCSRWRASCTRWT